MRTRTSSLPRGWHVACAALTAGVAGVIAALAVVQAVLRVIIAHGGHPFDLLVARYLLHDSSGSVLGLVAGGGVPVDLRADPLRAHITASWVVHQHSEL